MELILELCPLYGDNVDPDDIFVSADCAEFVGSKPVDGIFIVGSCASCVCGNDCPRCLLSCCGDMTCV
jgi:hypothetical protein